jgi:hypothetical protein
LEDISKELIKKYSNLPLQKNEPFACWKELIPGKSNYPAAAALCEQVKVLNSIWRSLNGGLRLKVSFAALTGVASSAGRSSFTEKWSTAQFNSNIFSGDFSRRFTLHNGANSVLLLRSKTHSSR